MKTKNYNYYLLALISTFRVRLSSSIRKLTTPGLFFLISNLILIPQITYSNDTLQMLYPKIYSNSPVNEGDSIILIVSNTGILPIVWTGPNGFSSSLVYNVIINVDSNATGTYYCNIIDTINDTTYFISTLIKVKSKPLHHIITITTYDTNICENASIELTATSGFGPYDWYDDLNNYYGQTAGNTITIGQVLQSTTFIVYCGPNGSLSGQISIVAFDCCADLGENILLLDNKNCLTAPVNLPPKIAINGFFLYNIDNYSFPNVSEIVMRDNSLIFGTGRDVNIHDLYIHGCNHIWNGIQFDNLNCTGLKLIQMKNCTLENMEGGFSVSSFSAISPTSLIEIDFSNNNFFDNYVSMFVSGFTLGYDIFKFRSNTFGSNGGVLLPPFQNLHSWIGMWLIWDELNFENNVSYTNYFQDLSVGILAQDSKIKIPENSCQFDNILPQQVFFAINCNGSAIYFDSYIGSSDFLQKNGVNGVPGAYDFKNCFNGIKILTGNGYISNNVMSEVNYGVRIEYCQNRDISISNNNITCDYVSTNPQSGSPKGIYIYQCDPMNQVSIIDNYIQVLPLGTGSGCIFQSGSNVPSVLSEKIYNNHLTILNGPSSSWKFGFYGINCSGISFGEINNSNTIHINNPQYGNIGVFIGNCDDIIVNHNFVYGSGYNVGYPGAFLPKGIYAASTTNSIYSCNSLEDLVNGMTFEGLCLGTTDNIKGNVINNYWLGLYYDSQSLTGNQNWTGNQWTGINGYFGALNDNPFYANSRYYVSYPPSLYLPTTPTNNPNNTGWFNYILHSTFQCSSDINSSNDELIDSPIENYNIINHLDSTIALNNLSFQEFNQEIGWVCKRYLLNKIEDNPSILNVNPLMNNFYSNNSNSSAGKFQKVTRARKEALTIDSGLSNIINQLKHKILSMVDSIYLIDSLFATGLNAPDSIQLSQTRFSLIQIYHNTTKSLDSLLQLAENTST